MLTAVIIAKGVPGAEGRGARNGKQTAAKGQLKQGRRH